MKKKWLRLCLIGALTLLLAFLITACGNKEGNKKGSYKEPYSLDDTIEITAGDYVAFSHLVPGGSKVKDVLKLKISNMQLQQRTVTEYADFGDYINQESGTKNENWYMFSFDLEILESDVFEAKNINMAYVSVHSLSANGQTAGDRFPPDGAESETDGTPLYLLSVVPLEGAKWSCYTWLAPDDGADLDCVMFGYFGVDAEHRDVYVKV